MTVKQLIQILKNSPPNDQVLVQVTYDDAEYTRQTNEPIGKIVSGGGLTTLELKDTI